MTTGWTFISVLSLFFSIRGPFLLTFRIDMNYWLDPLLVKPSMILYNYIPHFTLIHATLDTWHYDDVIMGAMASQITSLTIVYSTVYPSIDHIKHQSSASLAFVRGIHRGPVNSPHKLPVTRKMFPFHNVIMICVGRSCVFSITCISWEVSLNKMVR